MEYKKKRNLDGAYFRVQRNGEWENICFSDLTPFERNVVMNDKENQWLKTLCQLLAATIYDIGDKLDIESDEPNYKLNTGCKSGNNLCLKPHNTES